MNILFIHQNFPGQFRYLAPALAEAGHKVTALTLRKFEDEKWNGVSILNYKVGRGSTASIHPWVGDLETKVIRAEGLFRAALGLRAQGYVPDVVIAHPGWGESLFVKEVWPSARLGLYCEFFYNTGDSDINFDPEFSTADVDAARCRLKMKNVNQLLHFDLADSAISPTRWQASTYPGNFREKIAVVHDGIDTDQVKPNPHARLWFANGLTLGPHDELITFVNRNLEPYRGYHVFMRALPELLKQRPAARVLIVGGDDVSYGAKPDPAIHGAGTWKEVMIREVAPQIRQADWSRVHFLGKIPYTDFLSLLQVSSVHVYLTYPFVLSWSLLEAMSAGCAIVASNTAPVSEVIEHGKTGALVDFFKPGDLTDQVCSLLDNQQERSRLGGAAREKVRLEYDLQSVCLPQQLKWVSQLVS